MEQMQLGMICLGRMGTNWSGDYDEQYLPIPRKPVLHENRGIG